MFPDSDALQISSVYQHSDESVVSNNMASAAKGELETGGLLPIPKKSRTIKTDKPRPYLCPICTRGFVRQEHLKRHQRSHTNEKPFLCVFCGRCFARRDLVLRHQHKLHGSLVGSSSPSNISSSNSLTEISDVGTLSTNDMEKHIIKVAGNKEAILPTPSNPLARTAAQLKKDAREAAATGKTGSSISPLNTTSAVSSSSSLNSMSNRDSSISLEAVSKKSLSPVIAEQSDKNPPKRRKRHASFSATSAFTYINDNQTSQQVLKELHSIQDIPHQVGFSTPQLNAQQLLEKFAESGVVDADLLGLPSDFCLDEYAAAESSHRQDQQPGQDYFSQPTESNSSVQNASSEPFSNIPMTPSAFLHNAPSLVNFLTMGSTAGGAGGFAGITAGDSNLTSFKYEPFESESYLEMPTEKINAGNKSVGTSRNTELPQEDLWISDLVGNSRREPAFKLDFEHFNDIGFVDTFTNKSSSATPMIMDAATANSFSPASGNSQSASQPIKLLQKDRTSISPASNPSSGSTQYHPEKRRASFSLGPAVSSLFNSRQKDLFQMISEFQVLNSSPSPRTSSSGESPLSPGDASAKYRKGSRLILFDAEFREAIIRETNLQSKQFPKLDELNAYVNLYQSEFHRYFPFIHLHSLVPSMNNLLIILSITMIGALYAFHSSHAMLLSNIARLKVRDRLNNIHNNFETTPLSLIQSMVLLTFFGIFSNDSNVTNGMSNKVMMLIKLVKSSKLNMPLETLQTPPIESDHVLEFQDNPEVLNRIRSQYNTPQQIRRNFKYFITAQARIRTCHIILLISNLFTSLVGLEGVFHSIDLKCGVPCFHERLFACEDAIQWARNLKKYHIVLDSKFSLIQLSNGEDYSHCLMYISTGSQYYYENSKISFRTLLSMLISVHEKIFLERNNMKYEVNEQVNEIKWRMNSRPVIDAMLKHWEAIFIKSGGTLACHEENIPMINENPAMRLIIPLHLFANIRKCLDLRRVMNRIWLKDWEGMNEGLSCMSSNKDSLREASSFALNIVRFWAETVSVMKNAERTAIRTPIFSITCIFSSILIVAEYMRRVEAWAQDFDPSNPTAQILNASDRMFWLKSEQVLKKVEEHLLPKGYNSQSYAEFLRSQAKGALDVDVLDNELARRAMKPDTPTEETKEVIIKARLSSRSLYLGVRILGDAPIWPIALLFAHALQARAIYNLEDRSTSSKPE